MVSIDYIANILDWLNYHNIHYEIDDDRSYYDGIDDMLCIYMNNKRYKFLQNVNKEIEDNQETYKYTNFTLYNNENSIYDYINVVEFLKNDLSIN